MPTAAPHATAAGSASQAFHPRCTCSAADAYAPVPKNRAWPNEYCPPNPASRFHAWPSKVVYSTMMARLRTKPEDTKTGSSATASAKAPIAASSRTAEQPLRPEQQDRDEHDEDADLPEALAQPQPAERLDHADDEPARERAGEAPHAAEHHDGERDQHEAVPDLRVDVVGGQQEACRGAQAREADAEAHREHVLDVDADQARALRLLRDRADRTAEVGAGDEQPQHARDREGAEKRHHLRDRDHRAGDVHGRERVGG